MPAIREVTDMVTRPCDGGKLRCRGAVLVHCDTMIAE